MPPPYRLNPLYTPEFMESLRHGYMQTNEPMWSIATRHGIGTRTLEKIVAREGWPKRRERVRTILPAQHLLDEAEAMLAASAAKPPPTNRGASEPGGDPIDAERPPPGALRAPPSPFQGEGKFAAASSPPAVSAVDRIERLVLAEISIEETRREKLAALPRPTAEAALTARTLATLTQTLYALKRLRHGEEVRAAGKSGEENDSDMPDDIDEFRHELARRIDAFVASRSGGSDAAAGNLTPSAEGVA